MSSYLDKFDHMVVLMMENRSFDNMLGYLGTQVDGVVGKTLSNPAPVLDTGQPDSGGPVPVSPGEVMENPNPDPGEYYPHVNTQMFGLVDPASNAYQAGYEKFQAPYNRPKRPPAVAPMCGFVQDYFDNFRATQGRFPTRDEYSVIMSCFPTALVPVISTLASSFAVCDQWHCAVPSQTFCNRSFFHAGTSNGNVTNAPLEKWVHNDNETLFNRIQDATHRGLSWAVYYDAEDVFPLTLLIHFPKLWEHFFTHFHHMDVFWDHVREGKLPSYSFVEPRLFLNHNDQHPPIQIAGWTQPSTVTAGEQLIASVYDAIKSSDSPTGNSSQNTLFTITYDEHGGCYDHVSPPAATPPDDPPVAGQMDCRFDQLGVRVPTVMVSAWSESNVVSETLQHSSMLRVLCKKWSLEPLTRRDTTAPEFPQVFNRSTPRPASDWPDVHPLSQAAESEGQTNHDLPLNELQKAIVGMVNALGDDHADLPEQLVVGEALGLMKKKLESMRSGS